LATSEYVAERLNTYPLAHWLLMGAMADLGGGPLASLQGDGMFAHFRPRYRGTLIANVRMTRERGNQLIAQRGWPTWSRSVNRSSPTPICRRTSPPWRRSNNPIALRTTRPARGATQTIPPITR
jgi:hypothetical protein